MSKVETHRRLAPVADLFVMRQRSRIIAALSLAAAVAVAIFVAASRSLPPLDVSVVSVDEIGERKFVTMEFRRCQQAARFDGDQWFQLRLAGRWGALARLPDLGDRHLLSNTNRERIVLSIPAESDAFRVSLGYRVGLRPYCQAYFFLQRHGLFARFPKLSRAVLKCFPQQPGLKRMEREFPISTGTHNRSLHSTPR